AQKSRWRAPRGAWASQEGGKHQAANSTLTSAMAGSEAPAAATAGAAASQRPQRQQPPALGKIGDASQLVEAALQARVAASQDQRFATTKTLFFALSSLCGVLRLELRMKHLGQGKSDSELRADCEACNTTLQGVLSNKKLEVTA
ncbi:unnamed protein product, partial [Ectocarpus sp. 13 AM-2016]